MPCAAEGCGGDHFDWVGQSDPWLRGDGGRKGASSGSPHDLQEAQFAYLRQRDRGLIDCKNVDRLYEISF